MIGPILEHHVAPYCILVSHPMNLNIRYTLTRMAYYLFGCVCVRMSAKMMAQLVKMSHRSDEIFIGTFLMSVPALINCLLKPVNDTFHVAMFFGFSGDIVI